MVGPNCEEVERLQLELTDTLHDYRRLKRAHRKVVSNITATCEELKATVITNEVCDSLGSDGEEVDVEYNSASLLHALILQQHLFKGTL